MQYVEEVGVSVRWANCCFPDFVEHHYSCKSFFWKIICLLYLLCLSSVYGIEFFEKVNERNLRDSLHSLFRRFDWLSESVWLQSNFFESHSDFFSKNFLDFGLDTFEKQSIMKELCLCSFYWFQGHLFVGERRLQPFVHSFILFLWTAFHNQRSMSSNFLVFQIPGNISSKPADFRF